MAEITYYAFRLRFDNSPWRDYTVEGICRSDALKERQNYRITFEPDKMWMTGSVYTLPDE